MPVAATDSAAVLEEGRDGGWWLRGWRAHRIMAGITSRHVEVARLIASAHTAVRVVEAEQVHGSSIALVDREQDVTQHLPGCDALLTRLPRVALLARTADCLPIFFADWRRGVIGMAHVGWRGLIGRLPLRMIAAFRHLTHSPAEDLHVAIGPGIRSCCYEVGPEMIDRFGAFVQRREGRLMCDLIGAATAQLQQGGVRAGHILDTGRCTACEPQHWFSLRREGPTTGRMTSFIWRDA